MTSQTPTIEYYFSFISLWSYVGSLELQALTNRTNAQIIYKPVDLLAVFAAGGGKPVKERPTQRQSYRLIEMQRWRQWRNIPLVLHPKHYPADPTVGHRLLLAALDEGADVGPFVHAALKAVWADELDIANSETLIDLANRTGLDGRRLLDRVDEQELKDRELSLTTEAINRQLFGAPFYFYKEEPFWGQDRLDMLEAAIVSGRTAFLTD